MLDERVGQKEGAYSRRGYHVYPYLEGTHYIFPWDKMYIYNVRLQQVTHTFGVLTSDGLEIQAEIAITWKPVEGDLGRLHRDIGPNYVNVLLIPTVGSCAREEIARFLPDALYSAKRLDIQEAIRGCVKETMLSRFTRPKSGRATSWSRTSSSGTSFSPFRCATPSRTK